MRLSLKIKIIFITVAILAFTTVAGMIVTGYLFTEVYSTALKSKVSVIGGSLVSQLNRLLALGIPLNELVGFEEQCQEIAKKHQDISYAMVVDTRGKILFHNDPSQHGKPLTSPARLKAIQDDKEDSLKRFEQGEKYYESVLPILEQDGQHVGDIIIGFPARVVSQETKRLVAYSVAIVFVSFGIAVILLVFALSSWISNPLVRLLAAIQEVRKKGTDFTGRVEVLSRDEIGELASAFNLMTEDLKQTTVSKDYVDSIIACMIDILIVIDAEGRIQTVNRAACESLGYGEGELLGHPIQMIFPDVPLAEGSASEERTQVKLFEGGVWRNLETSLKTKDGQEIPVLLNGSSMMDKKDPLIRMVFTARDITERKRSEEERERLIHQLQDALLKVNTLSGLLPICSSCKRIRNERGDWNRIESYIREHSEADFSHSICPECAKRLYPEYYDEKSE